MKSLRSRRGRPRLPAQTCSLAIVIAVPLAATCMFTAPTVPFQAPARHHEAPRTEQAASTEDRQRRPGEAEVFESGPHDPPHQVCPWAGSPKLPGSAEARQAVYLPANPPGVEFDRPAMFLILPDELAASPLASRGPPFRSDIRC